MTCTRPYVYYPSPNSRGQVSPCRRCMSCRIALTNEWTTRLMHEAGEYPDNCFITLTYRDEDLPENRSLSKRTLQLFIKRLRKYLDGRKIKYYAVGEYGDKHDREHYHLIVFGWQPPLDDLFRAYRKGGKNYYGSKAIQDLWTFGFNTVGNVTRDSCQYVVGYVRKKLFGTMAKKIYGQRIPPFALQSHYIGARYAVRHSERIHTELSVIEGRKNIGLPRYYQRVLGVDTVRLKEKAKTKMLADEYDFYKQFPDGDYEAHKLKMRDAKELKLSVREKINTIRKGK